MAQIIVDPAEQRAFADALGDLVYEMKGRENALADHFAKLELTWRDEHARRFAAAQLEMSLYLKAFYNRSELYGDYLRQKARAGEDYLRQGR